MSSKETSRAQSRARGAVVGGMIAIVCLASMAYASVGSFASDGGGVSVAVIHDGEGGVREMPLDRDTAIEVVTSLGTNVVAVEGGRVYVADADCAGHDCMAQGPISQPGEQIVCLPHKLWIEVSSGEGGEGRGFDAVSR